MEVVRAIVRLGLVVATILRHIGNGFIVERRPRALFELADPAFAKHLTVAKPAGRLLALHLCLSSLPFVINVVGGKSDVGNNQQTFARGHGFFDLGDARFRTRRRPGSRVISAQKANTANAFSLDGLALSTANLYSAVQPGGSLYGLQHSNPVDTAAAYKGPPRNFGLQNDPLVGEAVGGVNVFGGGLGLYNGAGIIGGVGLSGDTSCADHMIAWRVRSNLGLDVFGGVVQGVSGDPERPDNIVYDIEPNPDGGTGVSAGGFGHPECLNTGDETALPAVQ